jgi:AcrR family transcriptional regulator
MVMGMSDPPTERAPRKDAVRNRGRLLEAAARAFREEGLGVSVNAIADSAGVNVATLYRHFPTKDHLIAAVLEAVLEPLATARDRALATDAAEQAARGDTLATFVHEAVGLQAEHRGLVDALDHYPSASDLRKQLREPAIEIVTPLVERAHRDGELRPDFDALDLLVALRMLAVVAEAPQPPPGSVRRYVDLVLRGLRPS